MTRPLAEGTPHPRSTTPNDQPDPLAAFLTDRLTEDLATVWPRGEPAGRADMAALLAVIDDLLIGLRSGRLPCRRDLRMLLYAYGSHVDYDPAWIDRLR